MLNKLVFIKQDNIKASAFDITGEYWIIVREEDGPADHQELIITNLDPENTILKYKKWLPRKEFDEDIYTVSISRDGSLIILGTKSNAYFIMEIKERGRLMFIPAQKTNEISFVPSLLGVTPCSKYIIMTDEKTRNFAIGETGFDYSRDANENKMILMDKINPYNVG